MPTIVTQSVYATIDGVPTDTPAWNVTNLHELLKPADTRTADPVVIIEAHGRLVERMWREGTTRLLNWVVYSSHDREGAIHTDHLVGLETNLQYLRDNVVSIPATATSTRTLVLYLPSGATKTGAVHVRDFDWEARGYTLFGVMELYLPAGELA